MENEIVDSALRKLCKALNNSNSIPKSDETVEFFNRLLKKGNTVKVPTIIKTLNSIHNLSKHENAVRDSFIKNFFQKDGDNKPKAIAKENFKNSSDRSLHTSILKDIMSRDNLIRDLHGINYNNIFSDEDIYHIAFFSFFNPRAAILLANHYFTTLLENDVDSINHHINPNVKNEDGQGTDALATIIIDYITNGKSIQINKNIQDQFQKLIFVTNTYYTHVMKDVLLHFDPKYWSQSSQNPLFLTSVQDDILRVNPQAIVCVKHEIPEDFFETVNLKQIKVKK